MAMVIRDGDIEVFLRRNAGQYPSQVSLIQAAVRLLWPHGAPTGGAERVVRVCLGHPVPGLPGPIARSAPAVYEPHSR